MSDYILLPVPAVASALSVRAATIRAWIARGILPAIRLGREYRVRESVLSRWVAVREVRGSTASTHGRAGARDGLGPGEFEHIGAGRRGIGAAPTVRASSPGRRAESNRPAGPSTDSVSFGRSSQVVAPQRATVEFSGQPAGSARLAGA